MGKPLDEKEVMAGVVKTLNYWAHRTHEEMFTPRRISLREWLFGVRSIARLYEKEALRMLRKFENAMDREDKEYWLKRLDGAAKVQMRVENYFRRRRSYTPGMI